MKMQKTKPKYPSKDDSYEPNELEDSSNLEGYQGYEDDESSNADDSSKSHHLDITFEENDFFNNSNVHKLKPKIREKNPSESKNDTKKTVNL